MGCEMSMRAAFAVALTGALLAVVPTSSAAGVSGDWPPLGAPDQIETDSLHGAASASDDVTVTAASTLSAAGNGRQTQPSTGICSSAVSAAAASLEGLSGSTSYTWKAYSDSTCSDDIASASFTTQLYSR